MTTKWTRGPWVVDEPHRNEQIPVKSEGGAMVAICTHECVMPADELDANAHLIAAAPKLYAALESLLHETVDAQGEKPCTYNASGYCTTHQMGPCAVAEARVALAKARGEG